jgi:hypothetical protein
MKGVKMAKWPADIQKELCDYLNNEHPEWVMLFVKKLADQPDALKAEMVAIDADGFRVVAHTLHGNERLLVPFNPPLASYDAAKSRLAALAASLA